MGHGMAHHAPKPEQMVKGAGSAIAAPLPTTVLAQATEAPAASTSGLEAPSKVTADSDLIINVTGLQFAWIFSYPDSGVTSGEIHVPVGRHVKLNMNANDVIHAFWVPQFRLKQDVIPGRQTQLQFTATQVGDYPVICAELCGAYHGGMRTRILVQTPEDYKLWISSQVASQQLESAIALKSVHEMSNSEFLAPYANELGVQSAVLDQIPTMLNHQHHHTS
jgi:cytochrome c oxidase subunit 2